MAIKELSVFMENRPGQLKDITLILSQAQINLLALNVAETADYGILRLITDDSRMAAQKLCEHDYIVSVADVFAVGVPDQPGGLCRVLSVFADRRVDIAYMYSVFSRQKDIAYMIFCPKDKEHMETVIKECGLLASNADALGIR